MTGPLGIALIGCGGVAALYRATYRALPGAVLRLVVDVDPDLARRVADDLGAARWSTDWRDALADDVALADVSTPNHLHEEAAVALLAAGKDAIVQKPLAPSVDACRRIVDAASAHGRTAAVYMSDLEDPAVWDLRDLIRGGHLGQVTGVRGRYAHRGGLSAPARPDYWRGSAAKTGGGSFVQLAIHHVNLASWLLDDAPRSVCGHVANLACPNIGGDDTAVGVVDFARTGALGVFESSWNSDGTRFEVFGTAGSAVVHGTEGARVEVRGVGDFAGRCLTLRGGSAVRAAVDAGALHGPDNPLNQHAAFVAAVRAGRAPEVPAAVGMRDLALCQALARSAEDGRRVALSPTGV